MKVLVVLFAMYVGAGCLPAQPGLSVGAARISTIEVELVTLTPQGFNPRRIVKRPGVFRLVLKDTRGTSTTEFEIVNDRGAQQKGLLLDKERTRHWNDQIDLPPGTYSLRSKLQPALAMQIVIDANGK